jgi:hypothetical protein
MPPSPQPRASSRLSQLLSLRNRKAESFSRQIQE